MVGEVAAGLRDGLFLFDFLGKAVRHAGGLAWHVDSQRGRTSNGSEGGRRVNRETNGSER